MFEIFLKFMRWRVLFIIILFINSKYLISFNQGLRIRKYEAKKLALIDKYKTAAANFSKNRRSRFQDLHFSPLFVIRFNSIKPGGF